MLAAELAERLDEAMVVDVLALSDAELDAEMVRSVQQQSRLDAYRAKLAGEYDSRLLWTTDRSRSPGARLARDAHIAPATAARDVRRGRKLRTMPLGSVAFADGSMSADHIDLLCSANQERLAVQYQRDEGMLVAEGQKLHYLDYCRYIHYWIQAAEDEAAEDDAKDCHESRHLKGGKTLDGVLDFQGRLDAIGGDIFWNELQRLEQQLFEEDWAAARAEHGPDATEAQLPRTALQRRADALVEMARRSSGAGSDVVPAKPLFTVLVGYETFAGRICELADGTVLTPGQIIPWLDQADVERIVFDGPSRVIDVGRRTRLFTGGLRRAIEVRDRHCTHPGCFVEAKFCHVDHIVEYCDGGETTQENGRLLCAFHNRQRPGRKAPPTHGP